MAELLDIGNCLIDAALVVAVEPYQHGRNGTNTGALVHLSGGESVIETKSTLNDVKLAIMTARKESLSAGLCMPPKHP